MKHFQDENGQIFAFEVDGSQDHLITETMTEIVTDDITAYIRSRQPVNLLIKAKQSEINGQFIKSTRAIVGDYTDEDIVSWPTQEAEAKAWQTDSNTATPLLDAMLSTRPGIDKATLASRILANAAAYKAATGAMIGKKQAFEDQLYALDENTATADDIDAIVVSF